MNTAILEVAPIRIGRGWVWCVHVHGIATPRRLDLGAAERAWREITGTRNSTLGAEPIRSRAGYVEYISKMRDRCPTPGALPHGWMLKVLSRAMRNEHAGSSGACSRSEGGERTRTALVRPGRTRTHASPVGVRLCCVAYSIEVFPPDASSGHARAPTRRCVLAVKVRFRVVACPGFRRVEPDLPCIVTHSDLQREKRAFWRAFGSWRCDRHCGNRMDHVEEDGHRSRANGDSTRGSTGRRLPGASTSAIVVARVGVSARPHAATPATRRPREGTVPTMTAERFAVLRGLELTFAESRPLVTDNHTPIAPIGLALDRRFDACRRTRIERIVSELRTNATSKLGLVRTAIVLTLLYEL